MSTIAGLNSALNISLHNTEQVIYQQYTEHKKGTQEL